MTVAASLARGTAWAALLGSFSPERLSCRGRGWEPVGESDFGSDEDRERDSGPGGSWVRTVSFGTGELLTVEWREPDYRIGVGPSSLSVRTWDGVRWGAVGPPVITPAHPDVRRIVRMTPTIPAGWMVVLDSELHLYRGGQWRVLPMPERPILNDHSCVASGLTLGSYDGPVTVAYDPEGAAWFFEPIEEHLNAWRRDGDQWQRVGRFQAGTLRGGVFDDPPRPAAPAVAFDARGRPLVAWTVFEDEPGGNVTKTRHWNGWRWEDLGTLPLAEEIKRDDRGAPSLVVTAGGAAALATTEAIYLRTRSGPWSVVGHASVDTSLAALPDGRLARAETAIGPTGARRVVVEVLAEGDRWEAIGGWEIGRDTRWANAVFASGTDGRLVLTWWDDGLVAAEWDGSVFRALPERGPVLTGLGSAEGDPSSPRVVVDALGRPTVAWTEAGAEPTIRVRTWTGEAWASLPPVQGSRDERLHLSLEDERPVVSVPTPGSEGARDVRGVRRIAWTGTGWDERADLSGGRPSEPLDDPGCLENGDRAVATFDGDHEPLVLAYEPRPGRDAGACWAGRGWARRLERPPHASVQRPLWVAATPTPLGDAIAWVEPGPSSERIELRRWYGEAWRTIGGAPVVASCTGTCQDLAIAAGGGRICVVWTERVGLRNGVALRCHADP